MNTKQIETGDFMKREETEQTVLKVREVEPKLEKHASKRKIIKQTDVDEKDQSAESFDKTKLIKENLMLLSEMEKLKKSNRTMSQRIYYLETIVKVPLKNP